MGSINTRPLKAFVRFDGSGRIVAGSLVLRKNKPKVGKWKEILAYECCNYIPTTTSTTTINPALCDTLGRAAGFYVLGATTVTNTGPTVVTGDLGLSPGTSVVGFPPGTVLGTQHITDTAAANAQLDANAAFTAFNLLSPDATLGANIGGTTILSGVYDFTTSAAITGTVTLDGGGNADAVFIFLIPTTFIPAVSSTVALTNGAQAGNVYWLVGSSATLSVNSVVKGNIIALTSVALNTGAELTGRAFALTAAVTMDDNSIIGAPCTINPLV